MGKAEFLKALEGELSPRLPAEDLADVLAYYEEYKIGRASCRERV